MYLTGQDILELHSFYSWAVSIVTAMPKADPMEMEDKIVVAVRVRPFNERERSLTKGMKRPGVSTASHHNRALIWIILSVFSQITVLLEKDFDDDLGVPSVRRRA
jgi:hypothetical protein